MKGQKEYEKWLNQPGISSALHQELLSIQGDEKEIEDRFGRTLDFGTGGVRGVMGVGLNRLNVYTIRRTSWALANYVLRQGKDAAAKGIAIGYDCRHMSAEFARESALTMAALGVRAYVSPYLCPTPEVSFSVRHFQASAGVMITASHNPPEYNGYKAYGPDGGQLLPEATNEIRSIMTENDDIFQLPIMTLEHATELGLFEWTPHDVRNEFVKSVVHSVRFTSIPDAQRRSLSVVYTPLHGAGNIPVREALKIAGYDKVHIVQEQEEPDGDFPTVKSPNPEEPEALKLGIDAATQVQADIVMGTDPDSDRVGIAVRDNLGAYQLLTGNQVGALLTEFILKTRKAEGNLPTNGIIFKTIVTSELGPAIAKSYAVATENTLTGFKYIGNRITHYERTGEYQFLLGYEESYGYLVAPIVRDKDAVQACLAIAEMATFYKNAGKTLLDVLQDLFERFGYYQEELFHVSVEAEDATTEMQSIMDELRDHTPTIEGLTLVAIEDYTSLKRVRMGKDGKPTSEEKLQLPTSDVLKYLYEDGSWLAVRPSGTEPKLKSYLAARGSNKEDCTLKTERMRSAIKHCVE